jgi:hypothetical protein
MCGDLNKGFVRDLDNLLLYGTQLLGVSEGGGGGGVARYNIRGVLQEPEIEFKATSSDPVH